MGGMPLFIYLPGIGPEQSFDGFLHLHIQQAGLALADPDDCRLNVLQDIEEFLFCLRGV
jgi:hypothetical protein